VTALTAAVVAAVDFPVGVGVQPTRDGTKPFAVIYPDAGVRSALTMKANDGIDETWICHCFGLTPESATVAVGKLTAAVYGLYRQTVAGRTVHYPEQLSALPLSRDDTASPALFDLVVEWRLRTSA
jgi:hypothetical protein